MKHALIVGALLLAGSSNAQRVKVSWGEESKTELEYRSLVRGNGTDMVKLCFENKGGGWFSQKTVTPILTRYDNRLHEERVRSFVVNEENVTFDNLLNVGGNLFMFTNRYEKSDKTTTFYTQKIDPVSLSPVGAPVNLGAMAALDRSKQSTANYELSMDSSKVLMFGLSPYSKKNNEKYYMAVYDNGMKKQWENTVELPYLDKFVEIFDYLVTNNGDVGVLIKHYDKEVKKEKIREDGANVPAYKCKFLLYSKGNAKPKEFVLDLQDKFAHDMQLTSDKDNNLTLFGLYKNKYDGYVSGYFIASLNSQSDKVETKKMEAFPEAMITLVKKDKQGSDREKDPGLSAHFTLADVITRGDGSTDYLLEYYKKEIVTVQTRTGWYTYPVYYFGDIVDVHVTAARPTSFVRLPKWQRTDYTSLYSSFKAVTVNNKLFIFYNDDRDNVERDIEKRPDDMVKFTKSILALATIDQRDNLTRSMVYDHKEMKLTTCIRVCQRLSNNLIGLYAQRTGGLFSSSKDMVGTLELK